MSALLEAHHAGLLTRQHWLPNIISGVIVGVVALPLTMAFAIASGAKPEQGIYTAIVAGFLVSHLAAAASRSQARPGLLSSFFPALPQNTELRDCRSPL